eukprot:SAG11_NODE_765_length_7275_cov_16.594203_1_plen_113_part_00
MTRTARFVNDEFEFANEVLRDEVVIGTMSPLHWRLAHAGIACGALTYGKHLAVRRLLTILMCGWIINDYEDKAATNEVHVWCGTPAARRLGDCGATRLRRHRVCVITCVPVQ